MSTTTLTSTTSASSVMPIKATSSSSLSTTATTLRSLYPRAARALLQRDVPLAHSLISSAFAILHPPAATYALPDELDAHRRKWDILRITLETTLYAAPPASSNPSSLPAPLRANIMLSPPALAGALHTRSLRLFTPALPAQKPTSAYLPAQILVALVLASLKLECPDAGCHMIEDWLAHRDRVNYITDDFEGYEKVVDVYCLHVLPRLEDWDGAHDFLLYEQLLPQDTRQRITNSLTALQRESVESRRASTRPRTPPLTPMSSMDARSTPTLNRSPSPSPSSSSSSSIDTTSTHTVVPHTPRANHFSQHLTPLITPVNSSSQSLQPTALSPTRITPASSRSTPLPRGPRADAIPHIVTSTHSGPPLLTLLYTHLRTYFTSSKLTFVLLLVFVPLLSFILRVRRRRLRLLSGTSVPRAGSVAAVDDVKRRLKNASGGGNILRVAWNAIVMAVLDTVRMGGRGLV